MKSTNQLRLPFGPPPTKPRALGAGAGAGANRIGAEDLPFHDWYRFVLSYPPHLVDAYLDEFGAGPTSLVLDPFCGTGTTIVQAKLRGIAAVGLEANPFARFATSVKIDWEVDPSSLVAGARAIASEAARILESQGINDNGALRDGQKEHVLRGLDREAAKLIITGSISPLPLHKALVLLDCLNRCKDQRWHSHALLAFAKALVFSTSNLHFGPEVGVGKPKADTPVIAPWIGEAARIAGDLASASGRSFPRCEAMLADARRPAQSLRPASVDIVITSPPYPNEKDYTRTTRLESVVLGFIKTRAELRERKKALIRSNTRNIFKGDDDDRYVREHPGIQRIAEAIEQRRIELGKTSGFERNYAKVTQNYFGGMARHLSELRTVLRPGARLAYVVGDQASYLRVMIRTGQLLAEIAGNLGYEVLRIDLFRTRFATATKEQLREEVVILRWPGNHG